jgi:hypothetical protein
MRAPGWAIGLTLGFAVLVQVRPALAAFHIAVIEEVFFGSEDCPDAQYVMLRTQAAFQVFVANQSIMNQDAEGSSAGLFGTFARNLPRTDQGVAIIMGTAEAQGLFGIPLDHVTGGRLVFPDGRVCFGQFGGAPVDCVAYGAFSGQNPGGGDPALSPELGMALVRVSETGNDAQDFGLAPPMPENNAGQIGQLGECPQPPTPTPTRTPRPTLAPDDYVCPGDCNRDRRVVITEVVTTLNITLGEAGVETCLDADVDADGKVLIDELLAAVGSGLNGCPPLGTRRFSINPATSAFGAAVPGFGFFPTFGFSGFLELRAGVPLPAGAFSGTAFVDITDASDYLSVFIPPQVGTPGIALCLRPRKDLFPILNAGVIDCDGGTALGIMTSQDHNIGEVGRCSGGDNAGAQCSAAEECPGGRCFSEADCAAAGGVVESDIHPGVCNGPLAGAAFGDDAGPGALVIVQNPQFGLRGLPVELTMETELPCGDEGPGVETPFALTTAMSRAEILNLDNTPGETFAFEVPGENFSCRSWSEENGTGTLVLAVPTLHALLGNDLISVFTLDD